MIINGSNSFYLERIHYVVIASNKEFQSAHFNLLLRCNCTKLEVAVGCFDGTARIYDLYGGRCSWILRFQFFSLEDRI